MIVMTDRVVGEHLVLYSQRHIKIRYNEASRKNARVLLFDLNTGESINSITKVVEKISLATLPEFIKKYISADPILIAQSNTF